MYGRAGYYMPDVTISDFSGKTFTPTKSSDNVSGHTTTVGQYFHGNSTSIAPGISSIINYDADYWLGDAFLYASDRR